MTAESSKICPRCQKQHEKLGKFCSRSCANSRGPRSNEFKKKVSLAMKGRKIHTTESKIKGIISKGLTPKFNKQNTLCVICNIDTNTNHRQTCSKTCLSKLMKLNSQQNEKCGGQKHTHRSKIINPNGDVFIAESSYEVKLSQILNQLEINWIRPEYFWYTDNFGNKRRYYPDFYLPKYDLYLDPKNIYLIKTDIAKIHQTAKENNISIVVLGEQQINKETILALVGDEGTAPSLPPCKGGTLLLS